MKLGIICDINCISTIAISLSYFLLPVATQSPFDSGPDPYYPDSAYSEVRYPQEQAQVQAQAQAQAPSVTLRIQPAINGGTNYDTVTVPLIQVTEYRADEPRYERARAGSSRLPSTLDVERAVMVDGPGDSDEIVCMFDGAPDQTEARYGTPFVWGEEVSFTGANAVSCIAFYYKGKEGEGGIVEAVDNYENYDGF